VSAYNYQVNSVLFDPPRKRGLNDALGEQWMRHHVLFLDKAHKTLPFILYDRAQERAVHDFSEDYWIAGVCGEELGLEMPRESKSVS
jgi:hypothetical protein